jgi:hypothetical protein
VATKKRSVKKPNRKPTPGPGRLVPVFSSAAGSLFNMTVTAVTSGTVLLCLFVAKRFS